MVTLPTVKGNMQGSPWIQINFKNGTIYKIPDTAPPTVIQAEGVVGGGGVKERGHSAESEISALIQERKEVTRAITEALPAWHPVIPQDTIPIVS